MPHDVFISYAFEDRPTADAVCAALEGGGIGCWIAPRDLPPGAFFPAAIMDAINESRLLVLVFSARANESPHVVREVERAVSKGIEIIPLRIENAALSPAMEYLISTPQWLNALAPPLSKHLHVLTARVGELLAKRTPSGTTSRSVAIDHGPTVTPAVARTRLRPLLSNPGHIAGGAISLALLGFVAFVFAQGVLPPTSRPSSQPAAGAGTPSPPVASGLHSPSPTPTERTLEPSPTPAPSTRTATSTPAPTAQPTTGLSITPLFDAPGDRTGGIAWDGEAIWLSSGAEIFKVDPDGRVLGVFTPPDYTPEGLTWDGSQFWLFTTNASTIYGFTLDEAVPASDPRVRSSFDAPVRTIGATAHGLAWDGSALWFSDYYSVYQLDARGRLGRTLSFGEEVAGLAWDGRGLWLAEQDWPRDARLRAIDGDGNTVTTVELPLVEVSALGWADGYLVAAGSLELGGETTIYRLDVERPD